MDDDLARRANPPHALSQALRRNTPARVALGRTGPAIPVQEQLRFQLDHALARDAVHARMDVPVLLAGLRERGLQPLPLRSAAASEGGESERAIYLRRPDLGRRLHPESAALLEQHAASAPAFPEVVFVLADGLSALAVERHALPLLDALSGLQSSLFGPVCVVSQGRVAVGDEIGQLLGAKLMVVLIGERPGLSSPDSLGAYITWDPRPGRTDAERNCISNIRQEGLGYVEAAQRLLFYMNGARRLQASGVALKENAGHILP